MALCFCLPWWFSLPVRWASSSSCLSRGCGHCLVAACTAPVPRWAQGCSLQGYQPAPFKSTKLTPKERDSCCNCDAWGNSANSMNDECSACHVEIVRPVVHTHKLSSCYFFFQLNTALTMHNRSFRCADVCLICLSSLNKRLDSSLQMSQLWHILFFFFKKVNSKNKKKL